MKHIDDVRGYQRNILFSPANLYTTSGGTALSNCVVEVVENDWQGRAPVLSLRFYDKPYLNRQLCEQRAESGKPVYDEQTEIGIEINLGTEMVQSLIEQLDVRLPELWKLVQEAGSESLD